MFDQQPGLAPPTDDFEPKDQPVEEAGDQFWALKPAGELVQALKDKERRFFESAERRHLKTMWEIAYAHYYGSDPMNPGDMATQGLTRVGPQQKMTRFRMNNMRNIVSQQNILAIGERPAFQCLASNSDYSSVAQIEIADSIIQYLYKKAMGEARERSVLESDGVWGAGYGHLRWDFQGGDTVQTMQPNQFAPPNPDGSPAMMPQDQKSGAPYTTVCYPWEVVQDPGSREMDWVIVRERVSKWEIAAKFPEHAAEVTKVNVLDEYAIEHMFGFDLDQANSDDCLVKHFYHPKCVAIPDGRYVGVCGDTILWDLPCPVPEGVPLVELCSGKYVCSSFGYANAWDLISIQEMLDQMYSDTATNLSVFGRQILFYDKGSDFDFDKIAEGIAGFGKTPGSEKPEAVNYASMPPAVQWFIEHLIECQQRLSSMNSVAQGDPKSNIKSGQMAALFHSIAIEFQSARQAALDGYRERMANLMLDMVRQYGDAPFLIEVAGIDERPYLQEFTASSVSGVRKVLVTTASPMMRSQAGRMEVFQAIASLPDKDERSAALEMITTGQTKGFTEKNRSSQLRIQWEHEQMSQGINPKVMVTDDPWKHVPEHVADLEKMSAQMADNPQALQAHQQHITDHAVTYQMLDPRTAAFLGIPAPPPIPGSPAAQLAMLTGGGGAPQAPQGAQGQQSSNQKSSGGAAPGASAPQQVDPSGVKLPDASQPPPNSNAKPGTQPIAAE